MVRCLQVLIVQCHDLFLRAKGKDGFHGAQCILSYGRCAGIVSDLSSRTCQATTFSGSNECLRRTHNLSLERCSDADAATNSKYHGGYYAHRNKSKFPLDRESDDICREEERDSHHTRVQFLGNALIDAISI